MTRVGNCPQFLRPGSHRLPKYRIPDLGTQFACSRAVTILWRGIASGVAGSVGLCLLGSPVAAQSLTDATLAPPTGVSFLVKDDGPTQTMTAPRGLAGVTFQAQAAAQSTGDPQTPPPSQPPPPRPRAFVYSDGYRLRAKIHRYASFATLPLFVTESIVGQSLYQNPTSGKKSAHLAVATGMGILFGVNSVTGVWNLIEARKDSNGRTRRLLHGVLLLAADAGFLATAALAPDSEFGEGGGRAGSSSGSRGAHRAMAFTSIGLASAGYIVMLFGGK